MSSVVGIPLSSRTNQEHSPSPSNSASFSHPIIIDPPSSSSLSSSTSSLSSLNTKSSSSSSPHSPLSPTSLPVLLPTTISMPAVPRSRGSYSRRSSLDMGIAVCPALQDLFLTWMSRPQTELWIRDTMKDLQLTRTLHFTSSNTSENPSPPSQPVLAPDSNSTTLNTIASTNTNASSGTNNNLSAQQPVILVTPPGASPTPAPHTGNSGMVPFDLDVSSPSPSPPSSGKPSPTGSPRSPSNVRFDAQLLPTSIPRITFDTTTLDSGDLLVATPLTPEAVLALRQSTPLVTGSISALQSPEQTRRSLHSPKQTHRRSRSLIDDRRTLSNQLLAATTTANGNNPSSGPNSGSATPTGSVTPTGGLSPTAFRIGMMASPPKSPKSMGRMTLRECPPSPARVPIRRFYFPEGAPLSPASHGRQVETIQNIFRNGGATTPATAATATATTAAPSTSSLVTSIPVNPSPALQMHQLFPITTQICQLPSYMNASLFHRLLRHSHSSSSDASLSIPDTQAPEDDALAASAVVTLSSFLSFWEKELASVDLHTRVFRILRSNASATHLVRSDFRYLVKEVVDRHPGLEFLESTPEFQEKYAETVIARTFFAINVSGNEKMTVRELKNSNFLDALNMLDNEEDINKIHNYFSYEHFYVVYCKFWQLDQDHDGLIDLGDLARYDDYALTGRVLERVISGQARKLLSGVSGTMNYLDFAIFLICEVDKYSEVSIDYWFSALDMDGDGMLTAYEIEYFFEEQMVRMQQISQEPIQFHDILCQLVDMVKRPSGDEISLSSEWKSDPIHTPFSLADTLSRIASKMDVNRNVHNTSFTRKDLKSSNMAPMFFNIIFNLNKFIIHEQRDPVRAKHIHDTPHLSDWDRYAIATYYQLSESDLEQEALAAMAFQDEVVEEYGPDGSQTTDAEQLGISHLPEQTTRS